MAATPPAQPALFAQGPAVSSDGPAVSSRRRAVSRSGPRGSVCVLGSGSGGNATLIRRRAVDGTEELVMVDAGFGPRSTARRMAQAGVDLAQLRAVCVTHFDTDHFRPRWCSVLADLGVRVLCHHWHLPMLGRCEGAARLFDAGLVEPFEHGPAVRVAPGVTATTVRCQHDRQGTTAYRFEVAGGSVGYATDLGHVPGELVERFAGVDVLCLESNYDHHMTIHSPRPSFVNRRNLSDSGHLSNDQALAAVQAIDAADPRNAPRNIVLLHRSSQCNHPTKVRRCFEQDATMKRRVIQTHQRRRTRWITVRAVPAVRRCQLPLPMCLARVA